MSEMNTPLPLQLEAAHVAERHRRAPWLALLGNAAAYRPALLRAIFESAPPLLLRLPLTRWLGAARGARGHALPSVAPPYV